MTDVKQTRWGLALFAAVTAAGAAYLAADTYFRATSERDHRVARQMILYYTLSRVDDPIIVLGDSIVEASTLPRSLCGHAVVNAGLNGASTASDLSGWLAPALANKRALAIVVSLGTNDALTPTPVSPQTFESRYEALLRDLSKLTGHLFIVEIPSLEVQGRLTPDMQKAAMTAIRDFRSIMPALATRAGGVFLPLPDMHAPFTIDGVHLNAEGYRAWDNAVIEGASRACG